MANSKFKKWLITAIVLVACTGAGTLLWFRFQASEKPNNIASGNGRIEATEIDIATKYQGRIAEILCREGDFLDAGQVVARMDTKTLEAQLRQKEASVLKARHGKNYAEALVRQRKSELAVARKDFNRSQATYASNNHAIAIRQLDHDLAAMETAIALLDEAQAQVLVTEASIEVALAETEEIQTNINDSILTTPTKGRILYRLAEPGEVLGAGGKVLTLLDLTDVYMTIFLPSAQAGRVRLGADTRLVFDALPNIAVPARVSFVAPEAQFTPKEVETRTEREKLMFRIKVKVDPELLMEHLEEVKTGVPGVAYVRLDPAAEWPEDVQRRSLP